MNIIITGFTGFLGKVVLLQLFKDNECEINNVYLLIRRKGKLSSVERFNKILKNSLLSNKIKKYINKIKILEGDLKYENLKIKKKIILNLSDKIDFIINCAASVKFDDSVLDAFNNNCSSIINILELSKKYFKNLKKIIHVSTFYVNFPGKIDKLNSLVDLNISYKKIISMIKNGKDLNYINSKLKNKFANTYVLTKCISEHILFNYDLNKTKISIVRPSIIANSYKFPFEGWNDSYNAYTAFNYSYGINLINYIKCNVNSKLNIVPVDFVSNRIISEISCNKNKKIKIINSIVDNDNSITMNNLYSCIDYYNILGYKSKYIVIKNNYFFYFFSLFFDYLPYYFFRILFIFNTKKYKLMSKLMNLSSISNIFHYYTHNTWYINNYKMNESFDKKYYHKVIIPKGINKYLLKTELDFYPILNSKNHSYFDILWLTNRSKNHSLLTNLTAYILRKFFRIMFSEIYINLEKLIEIIYKLDKESIIVLCPTHRTYSDFLIVSYILFELKDLGVKLPKIAAAIEFKNIPIIGKILENLGCFFIKRGYGKELSVNKKINNLIENNENIEFFIEGTRSRSRQYLPFKTGLIRALQETGKNFQILPITISYEKIPEQNSHFLEILSNKKQKMSLLDLTKWIYELNIKKLSYGNVYIKFSETINLKKDDNPYKILPKIMRDFQLNTVSTNYHYKFPIYNYQNIRRSGLEDTNHSNILEWWTVMNHWIYKYLSINNVKNIWEKLYIEKYNYLFESDKIFNENTKFYHRQYFKYINNDIKYIIEYIQKYKKLNIDNLLNKLFLGNIIFNFVLSHLKNEKILDCNNVLVGDLKKYII